MRAVRIERRGAASWAVISRPDRGNALGPEVADGLESWLAEVAEDETVAAAVITGAGRAFCSGADVKASHAMRDRPGERRRFFDRVRALLDSFGDVPVPVIAAVDGAAFAGGLELALACDLIVAGAGARFGDRHLINARIPAWGATARLNAACGPHGAAALLYLPEDLTAEDLQRVGLVARIAGPGLLAEEVARVAEHLASCDRGTLVALKRLLVAQRRLQSAPSASLEAAAFASHLEGTQMAARPPAVPLRERAE